MPTLRVCLFGRFSAQCDGHALPGLEPSKLQELFCYLLLTRDHLHSRETVANLLWGNVSTPQSKKYLRQALWQLQAALEAGRDPSAERLILVDPECVRVNAAADLWLDAAVFRQAFERAQGLPGRALDPLLVQALQAAVDLYTGDLLEGWFHDWCLFEREQYQRMYLALLDKLMDHCEAEAETDAGLVYGQRILNLDPAREHTHRALMRLDCLAGDRTAALRQYERCVEILQRELAVRPSAKTTLLYEQIRQDQFLGSSPSAPPDKEPAFISPASWRQTLDRLKQFQTLLAQFQGQVQRDIEALELAMNGRR